MAADLSLVGARGTSSTATVSTTAGAVSAGDTIVVVVSHDPTANINSIPLSGSGSDTLTLISGPTTGQGRLSVYVKENATGGATVSVTANFSTNAYSTIHMLKATGVATASYDSGSLVASAADSATPWTVTSNAAAQANNVWVAALEQNAGSSGNYASSNFTLVSDEPDVSTFWTGGVAKLYSTSSAAKTPSMTRTNSTNAASAMVVFALKEAASGSPAVLSSPTPSGTLGTTTTATLGATTDTTTGNLYTVVEATGALLIGITGAQIEAGNNNLDAAADAAGNSAVSTTTPSAGVSGLTASTAYSYATVQETVDGYSNIVTGTFTTAADSVEVTGTGAATTPLPTISGTGARGVQDTNGTVTLSISIPTIVGTGAVTQTGPEEITGTGALTITEPSASGAGVRGIQGTGSLTSTTPTVSGAQGPRAITGTGVLSILLPQVISLEGIRGITGTGALSTPDMFVNGVGLDVGVGGGFVHNSTRISSRKRAIRYAHGRRA